MHGNHIQSPHTTAMGPAMVPSMHHARNATGFDPELLFVECSNCGRPVLLEPGRTSFLVDRAGLDPAQLDHRCCILTSSCAACSPDNDTFDARIIRLHPDDAQ